MKGIRILVLLDAFPALSETFILRQITALIDRGCTLDILASARTDLDVVHADLQRYDLLARTRFMPEVAALPTRLARMLPHILRHGCRHPRITARLLDGLRHGRRALSLRLFHAALPLLQDPRAYDVVCCHYGPNGDLAARLRAAGVLRAPLVTFFYGYDLSAELRARGRHSYDFLLRHCELLLPVCQLFRQRLLELGAREEQVVVHHPGVDCATVELEPPAVDGPLAILCVARLVEKKGVHFALEAMARLRERHGVEATLAIVGDGPLRLELEQASRSLGLSDRVEFHGRQNGEEVDRLLRQSDVLVAPSVTAANGDQEGTPVAILDAMARGRVVVASRTGGIPEIIEDGVSGFLVGERDVQALAERLAWLHGHREAWADLGRVARRTIEVGFDSNRLADELLARLCTLGAVP